MINRTHVKLTMSAFEQILSSKQLWEQLKEDIIFRSPKDRKHVVKSIITMDCAKKYDNKQAMCDLLCWEIIFIKFAVECGFYQKIKSHLDGYIKCVSVIHNQIDLIDNERIYTMTISQLKRYDDLIVKYKELLIKYARFAHKEHLANLAKNVTKKKYSPKNVTEKNYSPKNVTEKKYLPKNGAEKYLLEKEWKIMDLLSDFIQVNYSLSREALICVLNEGQLGYKYQAKTIKFIGIDKKYNKLEHSISYVRKLNEIDMTLIPFEIHSLKIYGLQVSDGEVSDLWDFLICNYKKCTKTYIYIIFDQKIQENQMIMYLQNEISKRQLMCNVINTTRAEYVFVGLT
jgi:hypothetical protein